MTMSHSGT